MIGVTAIILGPIGVGFVLRAVGSLVGIFTRAAISHGGGGCGGMVAVGLGMEDRRRQDRMGNWGRTKIEGERKIHV